MIRFKMEQDFLTIFPEATIGIILCSNVNNTVVDRGEYEALLREGEAYVSGYLPLKEFSENPIIKEWREAYRKFKTKKGVRCSLEALYKRVKQNGIGAIGSINPLVDLYNYISLKYALPCGGEDIDAFQGDVRLTLANGTEEFYLIGSDDNEPPYPEEVVYKDDAGAICRCFNWREAKRTMLTEKTKNAFLIIEMTNEERLPVMQAAMSELSALVETHTGASCENHIVNSANREIIIKNN